MFSFRLLLGVVVVVCQSYVADSCWNQKETFHQKTTTANTTTAIPTIRGRTTESYNSIEGTWKLQSITSTPIRFPGVTLRIVAVGPDVYDVGLHVRNHMRIRISKSGDQWRAFGGSTTLMGLDRKTQDFENKIGQLVSNPTNVEVIDSQLHYDSHDKMSVWIR